jgi:hypothetical protein
MALVAAIITSIIFTFLLMMLISTLMNCMNFRKYKPSYDLLTSGEYQFNWKSDTMYFFSHKDLVGKYSSINGNSDLSLVFSLESDGKLSAIRLPSSDGSISFIHAGLITMDPYSMYYRKKFMEWFETNKESFKEREAPQFKFSAEELKELLENENN